MSEALFACVECGWVMGEHSLECSRPDLRDTFEDDLNADPKA